MEYTLGQVLDAIDEMIATRGGLGKNPDPNRDIELTIETRGDRLTKGRYIVKMERGPVYKLIVTSTIKHALQFKYGMRVKKVRFIGLQKITHIAVDCT